ncbi:MAG: coat protein [Fushun totivirus 2]|nr:MAG: coat protein [Fushun totivirus 2]WGU15422.1 coat protein [Sogatella furcifera toti-like virus 1]
MASTTAFLASTLFNAKGGHLSNTSTYRRYMSSVHTSMTVAGNKDSRVSSITYEVGGVSIDAKDLLKRTPPAGLAVESAYPSAPVLSEEFIGLAKKHTNFSATFEYTSLAAVAERLAKTIAAASIASGITSSDMRGGASLRVYALGTYDGPVNSMVNHVFIPRLVSAAPAADVFCVLANAVCGEGGVVATDVVEVDATSRKPLMATLDGASLGQACVEALRIVGANMLACNQGPLFAFAVTKGLHKVLTVVGHTDEGGVVRDMLRCGSFGAPFGGIHCGLEKYGGLPALASNGVSDLAAYVDALALTTAALVAHCDPGTTVNGTWFPTFYEGTDPYSPVTEPGTCLEGTPAMAQRNRSQLLANQTPFWFAYGNALGKAFGCEGDAGLMCTVASSMTSPLGDNNRHLRYPSVTPYFWIEPTSLIPHDYLGSKAEAYGSGSFATPFAPRPLPAWEDIREAEQGDVSQRGYIVRARSARAAPFLAHWNGHVSGGLANVKVRQVDPHGIVHPGKGTGDLRSRLEADAQLGDYLWVRGQSPFCAPGEFMNLNSLMGIYVTHISYVDGVPQLTALPSAREFASAEVEFYVGKPCGVQSARSNYETRTVARARTHATKELAAAAERVRSFGRPDAGAMLLKMSCPQMPGEAQRPVPATRDHAGAGGVDGSAQGTVGGVPHGVRFADEGARPIDPVVQHQPLRGPPLARVLTVGTGGGSAHRGPVAEGEAMEDVPVAPTGAAPPNGPAPE